MCCNDLSCSLTSFAGKIKALGSTLFNRNSVMTAPVMFQTSFGVRDINDNSHTIQFSLWWRVFDVCVYVCFVCQCFHLFFCISLCMFLPTCLLPSATVSLFKPTCVCLCFLGCMSIAIGRFLSLSVCLCLCMSLCSYLYTCLCVYISLSLPACLSASMSLCMSQQLGFPLSLCVSLILLFCLSQRLSLYIPTCQPVIVFLSINLATLPFPPPSPPEGLDGPRSALHHSAAHTRPVSTCQILNANTSVSS